MRPSLKKRFWTDVTVNETSAGFAVTLDKHPLRTPAKSDLVVPTDALARLIADEWQAVETVVTPETMPITRRANAAIDKVAPQKDAVAEMLAAYGGTDLLCYRAGHPEELDARQSAAWDSLLDWADTTFGARLNVTTGVVPVAQDGAALDRLAAPVARLAAFPLTGFHDLVVLSGSLIIALAAVKGHAPIESLWNASQVDEEWQAQLWGEDEEARAASDKKRHEFLDAFRFFLAVK